ncbi:hypothetical protein GCM10010052_06870 [Paenarthrobacter histidinolovorans]|nr:hypothetical protein GCM10010052_06870 [Paenarthrobacter histidinolovorans]
MDAGSGTGSPARVVTKRNFGFHASIRITGSKGIPAMIQMKGLYTGVSGLMGGRRPNCCEAGGPTSSVQAVPFHHRKQRGSTVSGYHPGAAVTW